MNADNYQVTVRELFALCLIRKSVVATNNDEYNWTFRHYSCVQNKLATLSLAKNLDEIRKNLETSAKNEIPTMKVQKRNFIIHKHDLGLSLSDKDEDLSWFDPKEEHEQWTYKGTFALEIPINEYEEEILNMLK